MLKRAKKYDDDAILREYYEEQTPVEELARRYRCTPHAVYQRAYWARYRKTGKDKELLARMRRARSRKTITARVDKSLQRLEKRLDEYGDDVLKGLAKALRQTFERGRAIPDESRKRRRK